MMQRFPIHIHRRDENGVATFLATTALVKLADAPDQLQAQLRDFLDRSLRVTQAPARPARATDESIFDREMESLLAESADETITLDRVREALSGIRGSLAQVVIEEREQR
jgi:hypothetical protein